MANTTVKDIIWYMDGTARGHSINGVNIEYQYDGAHDARPTEHTLHGLDGLNLSCLDWMRLSHVCRLMAARNRKPKQAFVRVSGWTADRPNMRLIMDVLQDDGETVSVSPSNCLACRVFRYPDTILHFTLLWFYILRYVAFKACFLCSASRPRIPYPRRVR